MSDHPNVTRMKAAMDAYVRGDFDALNTYYAEDVVWHVGGDHPLSGDYHGRDELFSYFRRTRELTGGTLRFEPKTILASDHGAGTFVRVTGERDAARLDVVLAQAFKIDEAGRVTEYWALAEDQKAVDAFWA